MSSSGTGDPVIARDFFYLVERASAGIYKGGWVFYATAPEFVEAPDFLPPAGTGDSEEEALQGLQESLKAS